MALEELAQWIKEAADKKPEPVTDCPVCGWSASKHPKSGKLHCSLCGWVEGL